jgi:hypothetical protein
MFSSLVPGARPGTRSAFLGAPALACAHAYGNEERIFFFVYPALVLRRGVARLATVSGLLSVVPLKRDWSVVN